MNSLVCWLDLSPEETRKADAFMEAMQSSGTRDELGFLALQRAFADRFYPATSTQLSYARYFYFLPALYELLERRRIPSSQAPRFIREQQEELREALRRNSRLRYRRDAKRLPSDVYWSALGELGLLRVEGVSEGGYLAALDDVHRGSPPWHEEGGAQRGRARRRCWDPDRPDPSFLTSKGTIRKDVKVDLTRKEAMDLRKRFDALGPNLLSHLISRAERGLPNRQEWPWNVEGAPPELKRLLPGARELSRFARGATLQYAHRLAEVRLKARRCAKIQGAVERAWKSWAQAAAPLRSWDLDAFFALPIVTDAIGPESTSGLERFVREWIARFRARGSKLLHDGDARLLVQKREQSCKLGKSRFTDDLALQTWSFLAPGDDLVDDVPLTSHFQLRYRHGIGKWIATQIADSLPRKRGRS